MLCGNTALAEISVKHDRPAAFRVYNGEQLQREHNTREEALMDIIDAARQCAPEPNYVYTEIVTAVNSDCATSGPPGGSPDPAGTSDKETADAAPAQATDSSAAQATQPPLRKDAPADATQKKKTAPAVNTPSDTKAADAPHTDQPPETHQAPAGKSPSPDEGLLLIPFQHEADIIPQGKQ